MLTLFTEIRKACKGGRAIVFHADVGRRLRLGIRSSDGTNGTCAILPAGISDGGIIQHIVDISEAFDMVDSPNKRKD